VSHNSYDHSCHGVAIDVFMRRRDAARWRDVRDVWPDDYTDPPLDMQRVDQSWKWTPSSRSEIAAGPTFRYFPETCKGHNWLLGAENAVCSKCGTIVPKGNIQNADQLTVDYVRWVERRMDVLPALIHRLEELIESHQITVGGGIIGKPYPFRMYSAARRGLFVRTEVLETVLGFDERSLDHVRAYRQHYNRVYVGMICKTTHRLIVERDGDLIPIKYRDSHKADDELAHWKLTMRDMTQEQLGMSADAIAAVLMKLQEKRQ
jgi:hypothetical protein